MTWVRLSDDSAMNPITLAVAEFERCDERLINETFGFVMRCSAQSGAHMTDYVVSRGTAMAIAGARLDELLEVAIFAGYMEAVELNGRAAYKIVDDPNFIHLRTKEEVLWEQQRKKDSSNSALRIPVRFRDGDACRYCLRVVNWDDRKGSMAGTYDHLIPGQAATVETYVVACNGCNSARRDGTTAFPHTLQPAPEDPYYSPTTREMFSGNSWANRNGYRLPPRLRKKVVTPGQLAPGTAPGQHTTHSQSPAPAAASSAPGRSANQSENAPQESRAHRAPAPGIHEQRTDSQSANAPEHATTSADERSAENPQIPADPADHEGPESAAPGRDGPGRVGPGRVGSGPGSLPHPQVPARRTRRGRRRRSTTTETSHPHTTSPAKDEN